MGPMNEENVTAWITAIKEFAELADGFDLTLKDIQWWDDSMLQSISLGKATVGGSAGFWVPEFSSSRWKLRGTLLPAAG